MRDFDISGGFWVFGYGSLVWNPGFDCKKRVLARLRGYRRSFCMWSIHHRGTPEEPGLVLALEPDAAGYCDGVAFHVPPGQAQETLGALRERELISSAYVEELVTVTTREGQPLDSLAYVIDTNHAQYTGLLPLSEQAEVIARAAGGRGPNPEYLYNTASHLSSLGIADSDLDWLVTRVKTLTEQEPCPNLQPGA